jgi:hypothetical protein
MTVMAVSPLYYFDDRALGMALADKAFIPMTRTDPSGRFTLTGLSPSLNYRFFAGGLGYVAFDEHLTVVPSSNDFVELVARPVYGAIVAPRDVNGNEPRAGPFDGFLDSATAEAQHAHLLHASKWTPTLLGVESTEPAGLAYYDRYLFFTTDHELGPAIPIRYRVRIPGYKAVDVAIGAGRAVDAVPRHVVTLPAASDGFGVVAVQMGPPRKAWAWDEVASGRECRLLLESTGSEPRFEVRLKALAPSGLEVIEGVPYGDYLAKFVAPHDLFTYPHSGDPPILLRVGPRPAVMDVSIPDLGAIELRVLTADGLLYAGALMGTHVHITDGHMGAFYFSRPPYRFDLVPPGEYRFALDNLSPDIEPRSVLVDAVEPATVAEWRLP